MAVPFSNTKLRPPRGFRNILEGLSREVLRCQPGDIYAFGSLYFDRLLRIRQASGWDPAEIGDILEDRFYNKIFKSLGVRMTEQDIAAIKIQTKYRQYRSKKLVQGIREERAAIKIQAAARGYLARVNVRQMREAVELAADMARLEAELEDEQQLIAEGDFPAVFAPPSRPHGGDDDDEEEEMEEAALKIQSKYRQYRAKGRVNRMRQEKQAAITIQAGYRGFKARQHVHLLRKQSMEATTADDDREIVDEAAEETDELADLPIGDVEELEKAAVKIQATYRGFKARKQIKDASEPLTPKIAESEPETTKSEVQSTEDEEEEYDEDEDDLSSVELSKEEAAMKIQAGIRGMLYRQSIRGSQQEGDDGDDGVAKGSSQTDIQQQKEDHPEEDAEKHPQEG